MNINKMPRLASANRGPAILIAIGSGFALVGTVPVAITLGIGIRTSATVIGVGFMGFGIMIMLPGICWCLAVQRRRIGIFCANRHAADSSPLQSTTASSKAPSGSKDDGTLDSLMTPVHEREAAMRSYGGTDFGQMTSFSPEEEEDSR